METQQTKWCNRCKTYLPIDDFGTNKHRSDGRQGYCRECQKAYRREHYQANKQPYIDRAKARNKVEYARIREWIHRYKDESGCKTCKVRYPGEPWLLEFDHRDRDKKRFNVSMMVRLGSLEKVIEEIEKCDLLCVVCHRRRTAKQFGW